MSSNAAPSENELRERQLRQAHKMEAVGRLAGGIAHDFNNLLFIIKNYTRMSIDKLEPGSVMRQDLEQVLEAGDRAAELTQQLLSFSRKSVTQPKILDLDDVVSAALKALRHTTGPKVHLMLKLDGALSRTRMDPQQVEQILSHVATNARDAMPDGGKLIIETSNFVATESFAALHPGMDVGHFVRLTIADTGAGMSEDELSHVFEPFFTTKKARRGAGFGLATVYGIVKQAGGYITIESRAGVGTEVNIYLAAAEREPVSLSEAPPAAAPESNGNRNGTGTLLVVDDEDGVRSVLARILSSSGYSVLQAHNGRDALELCIRSNGDIDLVLTDVDMPEMTGMDLAEALQERRQDVRILFMSGYPEPMIARDGVALDKCAHYLQKPFTSEVVLEKVREMLAPAPTAR